MAAAPPLPAVAGLFAELAAMRSPSGSERAVADRVAAYAAELGLDVEEDGAAATIGGTAGNLLVRLPPTAAGLPLVFCAHLDTVPVAGPLEPAIADAVIRNGSGAAILGADDKAAVAVLLEAARRIVEDGIDHAGVELLFTPMEEVACHGAKALEPAWVAARHGFVYDHAGPVGGMVLAGPFGHRVDGRFAGRSAHAGIAPEDGCSAIRAAALAVGRLEQGRIDEETTLNVGLIRGGTAPNIVPDACSIVVDCRSRNDHKARQLVERVLATCETAAREAGCGFEASVAEKYRGYRLGEDDVVVRLAADALRAAGARPIPVAGGGGSDANVLNELGIECLNLANGMARIHTPEEHIAVADLEWMLDVTLALVRLADGHARP